MAFLEGIRVQNYRALRDVTLGKVSDDGSAEPLTPLTAVIGKNGVGKSTLIDAFIFLVDCLQSDVEAACDARARGGFDRLRSSGQKGSIQITLRCREALNEPTLIYLVEIRKDSNDRPFVFQEILREEGAANPLLSFSVGIGAVWDGSDQVGGIVQLTKGADAGVTRGGEYELADSRKFAINAIGSLRSHPRIARFRHFLERWVVSDIESTAVRNKPASGPQRHLSERGDNISNVVQYMKRSHKDRLQTVLEKIAQKIPGIRSIDVAETEDKRLLLRFNEGSFTDPFLADQMSDGTLKLFTYLLLLEDPEPPSFLCIEEPENGLYHKLLDALAIELRAHATGKPGAPQVFVTTHQPYFVDALSPKEVWILEKGEDGFAKIQRASDIELVRNLVAEGMPLGGLWYSDYLDAR